MGRRGGTETVSSVLLAFLDQRTWRQSDLARHVGVERKQLVKVLGDLQQAGLHLEREEDHPHVYWSVPKSWFPGAVVFARDEVPELARVVQLAPEGGSRARILTRIATGATGLGISDPAIRTRALSCAEEAWLTMLQVATSQHAATRCRYYTLSRGEVAWRTISVHRIFVDQGRFIATCHRDGRLKWFRLDGILAIEGTASEPFRDVADGDLERLLKESADGFHSGSPAVSCSFRVRSEDARWVKAQLPVPFEVQEGAEAVFSTTTSGLLPLARFIVGLGAAARVDTPELRALVAELAAGALAPQDERNTEQVSGGRI